MKLKNIEIVSVGGDQAAAVSEGFCEPCRTRLGNPVAGYDVATNATVSSMAAQCPKCKNVYFLGGV